MGLAGVAFDGSPWVTAASSVALGGRSEFRHPPTLRRLAPPYARCYSLHRLQPNPAPPRLPFLAVIGTGSFVAAGAALMARRVASGVGGRRRGVLCLRLRAVALPAVQLTPAAAQH